MSSSNLFFLFPVLALGLGFIIPASATTVTIGATAPAGYDSTTFLAGNATAGAGVWTFGGTSITANSTSSICIDPLSTTAYFACATAGSTITANFAHGITGIDILWGSPDGYNKFTLYTGPNATGTAQSFVPGTPPLVTPTPPLADPVLFTANGGVVWQSVTFSSNFNSFEFANVSTLPASVSAIPEPSSIALLAVGFLAMGVGVRSRSRSIV